MTLLCTFTHTHTLIFLHTQKRMVHTINESDNFAILFTHHEKCSCLLHSAPQFLAKDATG